MTNAYQVVRDFENTIAEWTGAKYGVAVESCTAALFLCCKYKNVKTVIIPKRTYPGVACSILHAGGKIRWSDAGWAGTYELYPYDVWDSALRFQQNMYFGGIHCLSFHAKKHLPIGRGGMILTNDHYAVEWYKRARFDGRGEVPLSEDTFTMLGYNMYLTPEQAARGLQLFDLVKNKHLDDIPVESQNYPDLSRFSVFNQ